MLKQLNIDTSQTSERFLYLTDEILSFLIDKLQALDKLEQEIFERYEVLKTKRIVPNEICSWEDELWIEYAWRSEEIISPISWKPHKVDFRPIGKPTMYEYLSYPDTKICFKMRSLHRAVIEIQFEYGIREKHQFVLRKNENGWKIDTKKYSFPNEDIWHKCNEI